MQSPWIRFTPRWARRAGRLVLSPTARQDTLHEWRRRRRGEPGLPPGPLRRAVVICHGNICRSPFAGLLLAAATPGLEVRTAGLHATEGKPPEPGAVRAAGAFGVDLAGHAAHRLGDADVDWADLVLGMEGHHVASVARRWPGAATKARLLGDFLPDPPFRIEDPYGRDDAFFDATFARIARAVERLAARVAQARAPTSPGPRTADGAGPT